MLPPGSFNRAALFLFLVSLCGCSLPVSGPSIQITEMPPADMGGVIKIDHIKGRVTGAQSNQVVVLYARSGAWYVQPWADKPFTTIAADSTWSNETHLGTEYAALLVDAEYKPTPRSDVLPSAGGQIVAVATVKGEGSVDPSPRKLSFSGYEWQVRQAPRALIWNASVSSASPARSTGVPG